MVIITIVQTVIDNLITMNIYATMVYVIIADIVHGKRGDIYE